MFVSPISMMNYSCSRKNTTQNSYQSNLISKSKSDSISFGASFNHFDFITAGVEDFHRLLLDIFHNVSFSEHQASIFDSLGANVMKVVDSLRSQQPEGDAFMNVNFPHDMTKNNGVLSALYSVKQGNLSLKMYSPQSSKVVNPEINFVNGKLSSITWMDHSDPKFVYKRTLTFEEKDGKTVLKKPVKSEYKPQQ